jgi:putative membrane protein
METKATNDSVRSFARTLVTDHTKSEKQVMTLERKLKLAEKPLQSDTTKQAAMHTLEKLRSMKKGPALDSAFVQAELEDHRHDIADARAMANQAKEPQLKQQIEQTIPVLQKHLDIAQRLSQQGFQSTADSSKKR